MRGSTHYRRLSGCWPLVVLTALAAATSTRAQPDFPTQTIKVVVPLAAGGTADIVPRIVGEKMSARFGHPVVIKIVQVPVIRSVPIRLRRPSPMDIPY